MLVLPLIMAGCGGGTEPISFEYIERLPTDKDLVEKSIGTFMVPVPLVLDNTTQDIEVDNRVQINFDLVAIIHPNEESNFDRLLERHAGKIRDEVMRVCRNTTPNDIVESDWTTLKAHLLDAIQPYLGGPALQQLIAPRIVKELL